LFRNLKQELEIDSNALKRFFEGSKTTSLFGSLTLLFYMWYVDFRTQAVGKSEKLKGFQKEHRNQISIIVLLIIEILYSNFYIIS